MYAIASYLAAAAAFATHHPLIGLVAVVAGTVLQCMADRALCDGADAE